MIWVPPPHWMIAILVAFIAQLAVTSVIFYARGWKRGALAIPVGFILFVLSVVGGILLGGAVWQIDPVPILVVLTAGVYGTYALMMWRPRHIDGE
jgi:uncharacterized membrane protein YfcA